MTEAEMALFGAVIGQIALTVVLYLALIRVRFAYAADKANVRPELAYDQAAWPPKARQVSNAVSSQFELPVLFYAGVLFAFQFGAANWVAAFLAWTFVALRVVHAIIHTGKNVVIQRFSVFLAGFITVLAFWVYIAIKAIGAAG